MTNQQNKELNTDHIPERDYEIASKMFEMKEVNKLVDMLSYHRPSGYMDKGEYKRFLDTYIEPVFGKPDVHGNYIKIINGPDNKHPRIAYMAHHDTVHKSNKYAEGSVKYYINEEDHLIFCIDNSSIPQIETKYNAWNHKSKKNEEKVSLRPDTNHPAYSNCLGADCTTGIWLILEMIETGCPGVYVVHSDEEVGCIGSGLIVSDYNRLQGEEKSAHWLSKVDICMSFDRFGEKSIITYQSSCRTASDKFALELSDLLYASFKAGGFDPLEADNGGSYTDSNEYSEIISECTNISVGYDHQHSDSETQNVTYLLMLRDTLITYAMDINNPNVIHSYRDCNDDDYLYGSRWNYGGYGRQGYTFGGNNTSNDTYNSANKYYDDLWDNYDDYMSHDYYGTRSKNKTETLTLPYYYDDDSQNMLHMDIIKVENEYEEHINILALSGQLVEHRSEDNIDDMAITIEKYPFLIASLLDNSGLDSKTLTRYVKHEASRRKRTLRYEDLFNKDKDKKKEEDETVKNIMKDVDPVLLAKV